jgi:multiple sugar transport system substrate-binding protein
MWTGFSNPEFGYLQNTVKQFEQRYPWIHVTMVPGKQDTNVLNAIHSGTAPDISLLTVPDDAVQFCSTGGYIDLGPYIRADHIDLRSTVPAGALGYTAYAYKGSLCMLPVLTDAYGLYYNTAMFRAAGITGPPKTYSELFADAKKLTTFNPDGSIKVAGFLPLATGDYELANVVNGVQEGAQWYDGSGHCLLGKDPRFAQMLQFYKSMTDWFGFSKLSRFFAGNGGENTEFSPSNLFETGKLAMVDDGEWRVAFLAHDKATVRATSAPYPVPDDAPQMYGVGQSGGSTIGIPRGTQHPGEAWLLVKYLALDPQGQKSFADQIRNIPTLFSELHDPVLTKDPNFATFLRILGNPHTRYKQITKLGFGDTSLYDQFVDKYLAGNVPDLQAGLNALATQIDHQLQLGQ